MIPYGRQSIDSADIQSVVEVMNADFLTCGPQVEAFENAFAEMCGAKYAVSCSSGTAALHLAMLSAEISCQDKVVTTPITFLASANAAAFVGANPWFSDVDEVSVTLDPDALAKNWKEGTKAIVAVDYAGHPADYEKLGELARSKGAILIEDGCHAVGGKVKYPSGEYRIGNLPDVDMATFSFHPVKTMTTGEGGMLVTNNPEFADRARLLRGHGMIRDPKDFVAFGKSPVIEESGPWSYEMQELGYNYRLNDLQAALGLSQLKRLDSFIAARTALVSRYNSELADIELLECPQKADWIGEGTEISWHLYQIQIDFATLGKSRTKVMNELKERGVGTQVHYIPVSEQPYYRNQSFDLPNAIQFYNATLSLPLYPELSPDEQTHVVKAVKEVIR